MTYQLKVESMDQWAKLYEALCYYGVDLRDVGFNKEAAKILLYPPIVEINLEDVNLDVETFFKIVDYTECEHKPV